VVSPPSLMFLLLLLVVFAAKTVFPWLDEILELGFIFFSFVLIFLLFMNCRLLDIDGDTSSFVDLINVAGRKRLSHKRRKGRRRMPWTVSGSNTENSKDNGNRRPGLNGLLLRKEFFRCLFRLIFGCMAEPW